MFSNKKPVAILAQVGRFVRLGHCLRGLLGPNHFALCPGALGFAFVLFLLRGDRSSSGPLDGATRLTTHYRRNAPYNRHWWCIHSTRQSFGRQDVDTGCGFIFGTTSRNTSLTLCQTGWIEAEFFFDSCIFLLDLWQATSSCIAGPWWTACSYFFGVSPLPQAVLRDPWWLAYSYIYGFRRHIVQDYAS